MLHIPGVYVTEAENQTVISANVGETTDTFLADLVSFLVKCVDVRTAI